MSSNLKIIILAAGKGSRMKDINSDSNSNIKNLPKVLRQVGNKTMLEHVVSKALLLNPEQIIIVVSEENKDIIQTSLQNIQNIQDFEKLKYVVQKEINGTASAVLSAKEEYAGSDILVLLGDVPLIKLETLQKIISKNNCILGFRDTDPTNRYGRILLNFTSKIDFPEEQENFNFQPKTEIDFLTEQENSNNNQVIKIIEYAECNDEERKIETVNSGILFLKAEYTSLLEKIENNNSKGEYYLTDIVKILNLTIGSDHQILNGNHISINYLEASKEECMGANTITELQTLQKYC